MDHRFRSRNIAKDFGLGWLARAALARELIAGLKNDAGQARMLERNFDSRSSSSVFSTGSVDGTNRSSGRTKRCSKWNTGFRENTSARRHTGFASRRCANTSTSARGAGPAAFPIGRELCRSTTPIGSNACRSWDQVSDLRQRGLYRKGLIRVASQRRPRFDAPFDCTH
jgi:hypothetical protein